MTKIKDKPVCRKEYACNMKIIMVLFLVAAISISGAWIHSVENRNEIIIISNEVENHDLILQQLQQNPLEEWTEKCMEYEIIYIEEYRIWLDDERYVDMEFSYNETEWNRPFTKPLVPRNSMLIDSRNETICISKILVKDIKKE